MEQRDFHAFRELIHAHTGIWLRDGKQIMLASRLSRRLRHHGMSSFGEYLQYVQNTPDSGEEIRELINCVTTNKTSFFRERHHFDFLSSHVVPEIQAAVARGGARSVRIWSAASSTGEEPYTIAIALLEALSAAPRIASSRPGGGPGSLRGLSAGTAGWRLEVVASDIDTNVLNTARRAIYCAESVADIDPVLVKKYFLRGKNEMAGQVKVKPEVARLVQFQRINLKDPRWPLEGLFDVIFFRNALIYFNRETQEDFLRRMVRYLKPRGYLFLGNSEHIPWMHDVLEPLRQTMYRLRAEP
jgi:chemotaxis protein methyltransferase CheR